jgi:hypothetical protein
LSGDSREVIRGATLKPEAQEMSDLSLWHSAFTQVGNPLFARHCRNRDGFSALVHTDKDIASDIFCCGRNHIVILCNIFQEGKSLQSSYRAFILEFELLKGCPMV